MRLFIVFAVAALVLMLGGCAQGETVSTTPEPFREEITVPPQTEVPETTIPQTTVPDSGSEPVLPRLKSASDGDFVAVDDYIDDILTELRYATDRNFTGTVLYEFRNAYLRYGTVKKLAAVNAELRGMGLRLKIWDAYRPIAAQFALWEVCPDDTYVADPNKGYSNHTRGNAVDVTLVDEAGKELEMPTEFDDFSGAADRDYSDCTDTARENALLLQNIMEKHGFMGYYGEWWHFNDTDRYDVETVFDPGTVCQRYVRSDCAVQLFSRCSEESEILGSIPGGEPVLVLGYDEGFVLAQWQGLRGYVRMESLAPARNP